MFFGKRRDNVDVVVGSAERDNAHSATSTDRLGSWPRHYATGDQSRNLDKALRVSLIANLILAFVVLFSVTALASLFPLVRYVPWLVEVRGAESAVAQVGPLRAGSDRQQIIAEAAVMEYVRFRHSIVPDGREMNRRWGRGCLERPIKVTDRICAYMYRHSSAEIYGAFRQSNLPKIQSLIDGQVSRVVEVDVAPIRKDVDQYEVRFTMRDYEPGEGDLPNLIREFRYVATLWIEFVAEEIAENEKYLNPFGFKVTGYNLARIQDGKAG